MPVKLRVYSCLLDMYERYSSQSIAEKLTFENRRYCLIGERRKGGIYLHLYHCEDEQHYILVHLRYNLPFLIKAIYSVDEIKLADL